MNKENEIAITKAQSNNMNLISQTNPIYLNDDSNSGTNNLHLYIKDIFQHNNVSSFNLVNEVDDNVPKDTINNFLPNSSKKNDEIEIPDHSSNSDSNPKRNHSNDSNQDIILNQNLYQNESSIKNDSHLAKAQNTLDHSLHRIQINDIWSYLSNNIVHNKDEALIVEEFDKSSLWKKFFIQCSQDFQLQPQLKEERIKVFLITKTHYDKLNPTHNNYLRFIYHFLLQRKEPEQYNWELIGFQGEPQNDLRSVGMMGVMQMIALIDGYPVFTLDFFNYLGTIDSEWIFAILLLNMTKLTLDLLKKGVLITYCNKRKSVLKTLNAFFIGLVFQLNKELLSENEELISENNRLTIDYISNLISHIREFAEKNPGHFFWNENELAKVYSSLTNSTIHIANSKEKDELLNQQK